MHYLQCTSYFCRTRKRAELQFATSQEKDVSYTRTPATPTPISPTKYLNYTSGLKYIYITYTMVWKEPTHTCMHDNPDFESRKLLTSVLTQTLPRTRIQQVSRPRLFPCCPSPSGPSHRSSGHPSLAGWLHPWLVDT